MATEEAETVVVQRAPIGPTTAAAPTAMNPLVAATAIMPAVPGAGGAYDFVPKDLNEALKLADMLASSTMVPKDFIGKPGNCFIAMQWGSELGFKPLQAIQNIAVINGRPGIYGDAGKALLLSKGYRIELDDTEKVKAAGICWCIITAPNGHVTRRSFSTEDAKQAKLWGKDGPWSLYPWRQMSWRAFWFCARDAAADVLKGISGVEELRDMPPEKEVAGETISTTPAQAAPPSSKSASVVAGLVKPSLAQVNKAFADATNDEQFKAAIAMAQKLATDEEKSQAQAAYIEARKRIHPPNMAAPTVADVQQLLKAAKNVDELDTAGSMIDKLEAEPDVKEALRGDYKTLRNEMTKE